MCEGSRSLNKNLPADAVGIMKAWFYSHLEHPYPSKEQKKLLMTQIEHASGVGIRFKQLDNWFMNARQRLLGPKYKSPKRKRRSSPANPSRVIPQTAPTITEGVQGG